MATVAGDDAVECDLPPETGFEPDPSASRCPVCGGTEFELFLDATWQGPFPDLLQNATLGLLRALPSSCPGTT